MEWYPDERAPTPTVYLLFDPVVHPERAGGDRVVGVVLVGRGVGACASFAGRPHRPDHHHAERQRQQLHATGIFQSPFVSFRLF